jgi:hypothetical protein
MAFLKKRVLLLGVSSGAQYNYGRKMPGKKDIDVISGPLMEEMSIYAVKAQVKVRTIFASFDLPFACN